MARRVFGRLAPPQVVVPAKAVRGLALRRLRAHPLAVQARALDRRVDAAVSRARNPVLDALFYPLSSAADHSLLWLATAGVREALGKAPPGTTVRLAAVLGVESAGTNLALKSAFGRIRPALDPALTGPLPWGLRRPVTSAFPSGHASAGFTSAVFLSRADPGPPWYLIAGLVAFSRVYVRLHHTSDILGGAALGLAVGYAARRFAPPAPSVSPGNAG
ncbi:MAG TPA: phosphatase PAP2 family protein [Acidimicrobiia bacterium]|nr:phosphatase PAP2 family protein [Acidimicrobiia bacterium]